jgi:hypothetical protein
MHCPYCKKYAFSIETIDWMKINTEYYGGTHYNLKCKECNQMIRVKTYRTAVIGELTKCEHSLEEF